MTAEIESPIVCLYHAECLDGTAAAWVVSQRYPDAKLIPVHYHAPVPAEVADAHVVMVDFCYKLPDMMQILTKARSVLVIDHHEPTGPVVKQLEEWVSKFGPDHLAKFTHYFDMAYSGALLTYKHFFRLKFAASGTPAILKHICDRDLFEFAFDETRPIIHAVTTWGYDPANWSEHLEKYYDLATQDDFHFPDQLFYRDMMPIGEPVEAYHQEQLRRMTSQTMRKICFADTIVPLVNVPRAYSSDALAMYTDEYPFAVGYYDTDTHRIFSLRSRKGGAIRVNDLAREFGGGGHPSAAGFTVTRDHDLARL